MEHPFQGFMSHWVKKIYRDLNHYYELKLAAYGLTTAQVNVLEQLWVFGDGLSQKDLHEKLRIRPSSLTNLLDALVAGKWIVRKADPQDARVKRIYLTEAGQTQSQICIDMVTELEQAVRQGMEPEEINLLLLWMKKMNANIPREE
jgi:DNA-binding MarR family transcriptional regulator